MLQYKSIHIGLWLWLGCVLFVSGQDKAPKTPFLLGSPQVGLPFIQNFSPKHYQAAGQNFCILQDHRGLMYFGNAEGLLEYDGVSWRLIPLPNRSEVHSLAIDAKNVMYVGGQKEFGYLKINDIGAYQFVSLIHHIPEKYRNFGDVWSITPTSQGIYFRTARALYRWDGQQMKVWELEGSTNWGYWVNERLFLYIENRGLFELKNEQITLVKDYEKLKNEVIYGMVAIDATNMLIFTENTGMMLWKEGQEPKPLNAAVNGLIKKQTLHIKPISPNLIAIGTRRNGLILINYQGEVRYTLDMKKGLQDNFIWALMLDKTQNLWIAFNNGISLVELNTNFTHYNEETGLYGYVYQVLPYKQYLLAATSIGTFYKLLHPKKIEDNYFKPIHNLQSQTWRFQKVEDEVFVSTNNGLYILKDTVATLIPAELKNNDIVSPRSWFIMPIPNYPEYFFVNTALGLLLVEKKDGKWQILRKIKGIPRENLFYMLADDKQNVWIDNYTKGVFSLYFHQPDSATLKLYGKKDGLPEDVKNRVFRDKEHWFVATSKGIYSFDYAQNKFFYNQALTQQYLPFKNTELSLIRQGNQQEVWMVLNEENKDFKKKLRVLKSNHQQTKFYHFFEKVDKITIRDITVVDSVTLFATSDGIYEYHHQFPETPQNTWQTHIREVLWQDSVLYAGNGLPRHSILPYNKPHFKFSWASTYYPDEKNIRYQYFLEGFDKDWSDWEQVSFKNYTNLPEGKYTFRVKAKNSEGTISQETTYSFEIQPPWYRTLWAYGGYSILFVLTVMMIARIYGYKLQKENEKLEMMIQERSMEIIKQKEDIEAKNMIISEQNEELRATNQQLENRVRERTLSLERAYEELLKINRELDNFTYRAAHDIRGPISRLLGLCVVSEMDLKEDSLALTYIHLVKQEALNTQNILTKLVRVYEVKSASLRIAKVNLDELLQQIIQQIEESNDKTPVTHIHITNNTKNLDFRTDQYLLKHSLVNILENAFLYGKPEGNNVYIHIKDEDNMLVIEIKDEGMGIDAEAIPYVFDMFYRGTEHSKGAGLGLYIAKVAVEKLNGIIEVESKGANSGTTFVLKFPIRS
jgi:signal transduction histidine kinase/ligand-binding sensor domain-containing protein